MNLNYYKVSLLCGNRPFIAKMADGFEISKFESQVSYDTISCVIQLS